MLKGCGLCDVTYQVPLEDIPARGWPKRPPGYSGPPTALSVERACSVLERRPVRERGPLRGVSDQAMLLGDAVLPVTSPGALRPELFFRVCGDRSVPPRRPVSGCVSEDFIFEQVAEVRDVTAEPRDARCRLRLQAEGVANVKKSVKSLADVVGEAPRLAP